MPKWKPNLILVEVSAELAEQAMFKEELNLKDIAQDRDFAPTCKKNSVMLVTPEDVPQFEVDLYFDDQTGKWMLGFTRQQYDIVRDRFQVHDSLGAVVV